ncbi:MAG: hypothetical protein ACNS60_16195 [Candidatus Cyclobacteriaceae bacterium M2_1C_046]
MANLSQLKLLVNLARADGKIAEEEKQYIFNIGIANNVDKQEVENMLKADQQDQLPVNLSAEERFDILFKLVQLMKVDGKLFEEEIRYCSGIASRLGYREEVIFELMLEVKSGKMKSDDISDIREKTKKFLE